MTDRIIEIADTAAFLSFENHLLKIRIPDGRITTVPVAEIQCLILANPAVTVTGALLAELAAAGVMVVVSGSNRMPVAMHLPLEGNYVQNERFREQIGASLPLQKRLWQCVVREKIRTQGQLLKDLHGDDYHLLHMSAKVSSGDKENLEGRAAALYWKHLFPEPFLRDRDAKDNNVLLNYGYAILRAATARAIIGSGMLCVSGIHHCNQYNAFALADDVMEPYRPFIDEVVFGERDFFKTEDLTREHKAKLLQLLAMDVKIRNDRRPLANALSYTTASLARCFQKEEKEIAYPEFV